MINNIKTIVYHRTLCTSATLVILIKFSEENKKNFSDTLLHFNNVNYS
jgi:hypothetical protein